ncbi:GST-like protein [Caulobacter ginsengisoli]|uniref:GST-like protein n=1 Tax=Caulobacter ginsengisoli TaxID=400775 RepID=A0ABU0IZU3_9CAUL|nr:glutathione S-transferase family protein [Caulobacter ginsengisoli]MDQ0466544.1 GST-like protein [Caulobacter ginsengisoli]
MSDRITVYGALGSGSVPVEAALTLLGAPYDVVEGATWEHDPEILARVEKVNPLKQIPALVLPDGSIMTESGAMLIWLADSHGRLGPGIDDPVRAQFLRWMVYVPAAIYSLFWVRDDPSRLSPDPAAGEVIKARTAERILDCWRMMDQQIEPGRFLLGDSLSVLDLYVTVVSRWGAGRRRFREVAPKMAPVVARVDALPELEAFWAARFPFEAGWER